MRLAALTFDAYGTLFDVHSVVRLCDDIWPGKGAAVSQAWRAKQLEYTWLRALMNRYADFATVTEDALGYACASLGLPIDGVRVAKLMDAYTRLSPFPDVVATLERLRGHRLAILSNGSPSMLEPLVVNAGLDGWITDVLSVDAVKTYKPAPVVYQLAVDRLGVPAHAIGFVSSNGWDAYGAKAFGFEVFWINRTGAPADALGTPPDHVISALADLPALVGA
ncbi:MAG: haloacid dehalogenase type II [Burkholderiales bacterium]|jgi:2-haloacid dehalogenase|nr:haloacid dehalogenase type II [Burkholderiales bacterium]